MSKIHSNQSVELLINRWEKLAIKKLKKPKALIDFSQITDVVNERLEDYNPTKKRKVVIVFDDMISDMEANKNLSPILTDLF